MAQRVDTSHRSPARGLRLAADRFGGTSDADLIAGLDEDEAVIGARILDELRRLAELDRRDVWRRIGTASMAEWVAGHLGITRHEANLRLKAAHALEQLPLVSQALASGELSLVKVVHLTRFATAETEKNLIRWARRVSPTAVRRRAEMLGAAEVEEVQRAVKDRQLEYWFDSDGLRFNLMCHLPAAEGAEVAEVLESYARRLPVSPIDDECSTDTTNEHGALPQRRADALVHLLCQGARSAARPAVVVHAELGALLSGDGARYLRDEVILDADSLSELLCDADIDIALYNEATPLGVGKASYQPPRWLRRLIEFRDNHECTFPGCNSRTWLHLHHVVPFPKGDTDASNLVLVCQVHHKLIHHFGWKAVVTTHGVRWHRPNGRPYDPSPRARGTPLDP